MALPPRGKPRGFRATTFMTSDSVRMMSSNIAALMILATVRLRTESSTIASNENNGFIIYHKNSLRKLTEAGLSSEEAEKFLKVLGA